LRIFRFIAAGALSFSLVGIGCGGDDDDHGAHDDLVAECDAIVEACHPKDRGPETTPEEHECHELGEANNRANCQTHASCISLCEASGGDAGTDG
jgi:hypothetical protein